MTYGNVCPPSLSRMVFFHKYRSRHDHTTTGRAIRIPSLKTKWIPYSTSRHLYVYVHARPNMPEPTGMHHIYISTQHRLTDTLENILREAVKTRHGQWPGIRKYAFVFDTSPRSANPDRWTMDITRTFGQLLLQGYAPEKQTIYVSIQLYSHAKQSYEPTLRAMTPLRPRQRHLRMPLINHEHLEVKVTITWHRMMCRTHASDITTTEFIKLCRTVEILAIRSPWHRWGRYFTKQLIIENRPRTKPAYSFRVDVSYNMTMLDLLSRYRFKPQSSILHFYPA